MVQLTCLGYQAHRTDRMNATQISNQSTLLNLLTVIKSSIKQISLRETKLILLT